MKNMKRKGKPNKYKGLIKDRFPREELDEKSQY